MKQYIRQHRGRLAVIAAALASILLFYALRGNKQWMTVYVDRVTSPFKRLLALLFSVLPLSMAELLVIAFILFSVGFVVWTVVGAVRARKGWWRYLVSMATTGLAIGLVIASAMNLLWGANYYAASFKERSGIAADGGTVDELYRVTAHFAALVNETASLVMRGEDRLYRVEVDEVLENAATVYRPLEELFPFLRGRELPPRAVLLSEAMSWIETTGVTFPFTGECCVNVHAPLPFLASTAAHEVAHQRGVASEDEANFLAVLSCLASANPDFRYSGSMLGYITLSNALYRVDPERAGELRRSICAEADADLKANNAYWDRYETKVSEVSDQMYDSFLKDYDQPLGIQSYGAAADLLVAWYREDA